jgi:hypothetical protein
MNINFTEAVAKHGHSIYKTKSCQPTRPQYDVPMERKPYIETFTELAKC